MQTEQLEEIVNANKNLARNLNTDTSLEDLIRENSWFLCEIYSFKSKSKKGLGFHTVTSQSVSSIKNN